MDIPYISYEEGDAVMSWDIVTDALQQGHAGAKAAITDSLLRNDEDTLLSRAAWIDGLGIAVKCASIFPGNPKIGLPVVNGAMMLFDGTNGQVAAILDFHLVTKWKTAGDSLLGAKLLARPDSKRILIVGSGEVAKNLISAYASQFDDAEFEIWSRTAENAVALADSLTNKHIISATTDLQTAVGRADIICTATMSTKPIIKGAWLHEGQHLDLIGAYRPDMREVDDEALLRSRLFADSRETTIGHIGEFCIPIADGAMDASAIRADYYDISGGNFSRTDENEITLFKNGGGAHLDLMTGNAILNAWSKK